ncbi:MAG TPA: ATP-binding protein [Anaeromyxobacteraceae bacterium]|nr:ATP-binding protein [Anaeromyxobacteraceae bacterium]
MRSVRFQILALVAAVLLAAVGTYFLLATELFTRDKLAYVYDLESSLTTTVSEELRESLGSRVDKLGYFALAAASGDAGRAAAPLLASDPDLLSLEIWEQRKGAFQRVFHRTDPARLAGVNLSQADLEEARRSTPIPFEAVAAEGALLQNASLPPDVALLSLAAAPEGGRGVVVALLKPDRLLRIFARSSAWEVYLVDGRGVVVVHPDPARVVSRARPDSGIVRDAVQGTVARAVREFEGPDGPVVGAFSRVGLGRLAVVAEVPRAEALRATRTLARRSILFGVAILLVSVLASLYLGRRLTASLGRLEEATRAVAAGDFGVRIPVEGRNEIARLADAFNRMGGELSDREARLTEAHTQLGQAEKLSAVGEMAASVVHEVKNPMTAIVGYAQLGREAEAMGQARDLFKQIEDHAWRSNDMLQTLLAYARLDRPVQARLDPAAVARNTLKLIRHQLLLKQIQLETSLPDGLPAILGNANQLEQVLVNLVMNACQAMEGRPEMMLGLSVRAEGDRVIISVRDTGPGIPPEHRDKLFRPFFTTKPAGRGTGLGLSVSLRMVRLHRGEILVDSHPGEGTTFSVVLPSADVAEAAAAAGGGTPEPGLAIPAWSASAAEPAVTAEFPQAAEPEPAAQDGPAPAPAAEPAPGTADSAEDGRPGRAHPPASVANPSRNDG